MAAATLMPLLAKTFVDPPSNTTFEMVTHSSPRSATRGTPKRNGGGGHGVHTPRKPAVSPKSPRRTPKSPRGAEARSPEDVHSWSDATLAERYQFMEEVGYGNWGSVWRVKAKLEEGTPVRCVKLVHRSKNPTSSARVRALWTEFKCIRILRTSPHPSVIDFQTFVITPSYAIVTMDYHQKAIPVALPEAKAKVYFRQLLSAVEHLHGHGISHNDIKPSNIMLSADDRPILIDFGFAASYSLTSSDRFLSSLSWGTPEYLSPERAKGALHDERLSDIFALGITMYEIVVGRTPFEETEEENFLTRDALEVYYKRTLTGRFYGDFIVSSDFETLIHLMIEPKVPFRMQSCRKALQHRFFDLPASPFSTHSAANSASFTPTRTALGKPASLVQTPTSSAKKPPHRTPKSEERKKGFLIYQDEESASPARTGDSVSPFSPRRDALGSRSNRPSPTAAPVTPAAKTAASPFTPKPFTLKKTPPPSKIPVRKGDIGSPAPLVKGIAPPTPTHRTGAVLGHKRIVSSPTLPFRSVGAQPPVPQVPLHFAQTPEQGQEKVTLSRASSLKSVRRKPVPALQEIDFVPTLPQTGMVAQDDVEEVLVSGPTSPIVAESLSATSSSSAPTTPDTETFTTHSYTVKIVRKSKLPVPDSLALGSLGEVFSTDLPRFSRRSSQAITSTFRKLSSKPVRRAPSALSFAGLKSSFNGHRRRASLADSVYSVIEAEKLDESRHANTLFLDFSAPAPDPQAQRARMESFSRHIAHILEARKAADPFGLSSPPPPPPRTPSSPRVSSGGSKPDSPRKEMEMMQAVPEAAREPSPEPFSYNSTQSLSPSPVNTIASPPPRQSSLRRSLSSAFSANSPTQEKSVFKRGHRRIPTAIRSVPSVILYESANDGDYSESDYSRAGTPFEGATAARVASPPPPPRVVAPSRQLPTWVPTDSDDSDDSNGDGDIDEPTVTIISTPVKLKRQASHASSFGKSATPKASAIKAPKQARSSASLRTSPRAARPSLARGTTSASLPLSDPAPPPPAAAAAAVAPTPALPFTNFDVRAASRASTYASASTASTASRTGEKALKHKRSRSVLSFFFRSGTPVDSGAETDQSRSQSRAGLSRSTSRMSLASSLGWGVSGGGAEGLPRAGERDKNGEGEKRKKKGGRLRKAVSRIFS
ncbi:hypothetical protein JCM10207_000108 [Rhodosporidiobolus poonsookiae]